MIIEGNPAGNVSWWTKHLQRQDTNERVALKEIRGLTADDLGSALREMQAVAAGSRCRGNFMYQLNMNTYAHERLTEEQWREAIDYTEKELGLEGHQRVVIEHEKKGRVHRHAVWNRVDVDTLRVTDMGGNYFTHERVARELERRFGLEKAPRVHGDRDGPPPDRPLEMWEMQRAERTGIDPAAIRAELTELWRNSDSGKAFAAELEARGYVLARGDRRDFCVIDHAGCDHSLARRLEGVNAKEVRARMADIDRAALPSVAEARDQQRARFNDGAIFDRDAASRAWENRVNNAGIAAGLADEKERRAAMAALQKAARADAGTGKLDAKPRVEKDTTPTASRAKETPGAGGLKVADAATGAVTKLADFVTDFLIGGTSQPQPKKTEAERIIAQRRAADALEHIKEDIERGRSLRAEDIQDLSPDTLSKIKSKGDDYLKMLIEQIERDRQRSNDYGRERER